MNQNKEYPSEWTKYSADQLFKIRGGTTPSKMNSDYWNSSDIHWATPTDFTNNIDPIYISNTKSKISNTALDECGLELIYPGSILMTSRATIGKALINTVPITTNQGFIIFTPSKKVLSKFFLYWLQNTKKILHDMAAGSTFLEISKKSINLLSVTLPPLPEQKKIADILTSVDEAIQTTQNVIDQSEKVKQGLLQELLTKGTGHTEFKMTELGEIPVEWEVLEFRTNYDITSGVGFKLNEYSSEGIKLLRIDNVSYGEITWDSIAYLPRKYLSEYPNIVLTEGDILLALNRPITRGKLKMAKLAAKDSPCILYQRVGKIEFKSENVDRDFSYYSLSNYIKEFVELTSVGSDQPFISVVALRKLLLPFPILEEQKQIAKILSSVDDSFQKAKEKKTKLEQVKKGLMQDLLTGKVRVKV